MALSTAAKAGLGGLGTVSVGGPTAYLVWDKYSSKESTQDPAAEEVVFLNEVEQEILKSDSPNWTIGDTNPAEQDKVEVKVSKEVTKAGAESVTYKWECIITKGGNVSGVDKSKLTSYLKQKLNTDTANKQNNRDKLVKACSKNRASNQEANSVKASLTLVVKSYDSSKNTMNTDLLDSGTTTG